MRDVSAQELNSKWEFLSPKRVSRSFKVKTSCFGEWRSRMIKFFLIILFEFFIFNLSYAAPCYGSRMPKKKKIFMGIQTHAVFKRYLEDEFGKVRSTQHFVLLSLGVYDWLSLDLKAAAGNLKQHPCGTAELDYSSGFAGGYGFRLRLYERNNFKTVFGFQHISVHPRKVWQGSIKHRAILDDWQFSLLGSYNFKKFTPYLGMRWSRLDYIHWEDDSRKRIKSDLTKDMGLIVGVDIPFKKNLWMNLEGNFFDSEALALSINYSF
ncbi:MAG: hypothetical protein NC928_05270 [Candidatus Omnitrophica bacterium]|nr:hypothetical protein [Candidatus Omnitrophota bacterium]